MNRILFLTFLTFALAAPALAQDGPYVYATYLECDPAGVATADAGRTGGLNAALDAHVAAGDIQAWGWGAHHTGGRWTRNAYFVAPTLDALLTFQDAWQDEVGRDHAAARTASRTACRVHEDYIWRVVATSRAPDEVARNRPPFGGSTYFNCDQASLDRTDALVREHFVPDLNAMMNEGVISNWTWQAHVMGGPISRILVMDTASPIATVRAWERLGEGIEAAASAEFDTLCPAHQDYIWGITGSR